MGRPSKMVVELEQRIAVQRFELVGRENRLAVETAEVGMLRKHLEDDIAMLDSARAARKKQSKKAQSDSSQA
jgi:hypothetical protein